MRCEAPSHLTRSLLLRILAYKIQELADGWLDRESVRYLDKIGERLFAHLQKRARRTSGRGQVQP